MKVSSFSKQIFLTCYNSVSNTSVANQQFKVVQKIISSKFCWGCQVIDVNSTQHLYNVCNIYPVIFIGF